MLKPLNKLNKNATPGIANGSNQIGWETFGDVCWFLLILSIVSVALLYLLRESLVGGLSVLCCWWIWAVLAVWFLISNLVGILIKRVRFRVSGETMHHRTWRSALTLLPFTGVSLVPFLAVLCPALIRRTDGLASFAYLEQHWTVIVLSGSISVVCITGLYLLPPVRTRSEWLGPTYMFLVGACVITCLAFDEAQLSWGEPSARSLIVSALPGAIGYVILSFTLPMCLLSVSILIGEFCNRAIGDRIYYGLAPQVVALVVWVEIFLYASHLRLVLSARTG